jgi:hypothetical protein
VTLQDEKGMLQSPQIGIPARTLAMQSKHRLGHDLFGEQADYVVCLGNRCCNVT